MITKVRTVLVSRRYDGFLERFEALEIIENPKQIKNVWKRNKTPILIKERSMESNEFKFIEIPEYLIGREKEFINFCHENVFECGEFKTGNIYDTKFDRCFMCEIGRHRGFASTSLHNQYVEKPVDVIIYESDNFYVVPELGAMLKGYLMIVPKEHILSVAQFPKSYFTEYYEVCEDVEKILLNAFKGSVVTFMEHGSGPSGKTSHKKSIVHAHTHVVVDFTLKKDYKEMVSLKKCEDITLASKVHYFSYQEGCKGDLLISMDPEVYVQRQFPRQVMAEELNLAPGQYNWRENEFKEMTDTTLYYLYKYLSVNQLDERIFKRTKDFVDGFSKRAN